jgi:CHAT domain-containing protein
MFTPNAEVYLDGQATKGLVKQRLAEAKEEIDIIHFACHGYFDPHHSLKSGIMLASDGDEQNAGTVLPEEKEANLTAEEIFGLDMRADLVTLSACESGVNERRPGDELIGLTRALIYAGTPSVVVSLWSVDEISTSILMVKFYEALKGGATKAEALQKAQVELMRMTAKEVIAYCEAAKQRLSEPEVARGQRLLNWDIADAQFAARDFTAALEGYTRLRSEAQLDEAAYRALSVAITRCQLALRNPQPTDYEICLYEHPYHWAPFVLVGDWK